MTVSDLPLMQESIMEMMDDPTVDPEVIKGTIEGMDKEEFADFIEGFADHISELETAKAAVDQQVKDFQQKRDRFAQHAQFERSIVEKILRIRGERKVQTALYTVGIQKNGGLAPLEIDGDISDIPNDYLIEHDPTPDNAKIRELLKTQTVPWAHLGERGESLRIK